VKPVVVIRPQPGCDTTVAALGKEGLVAYCHPLFAIRPLEWEPPDPAGVDALLIGSANAPRHAGKHLALYRGMPTYVVGQASADAARAAELDVMLVGEGSLQDVLGRLQPAHRRLLRLTGRSRVTLDIPDNVTIDEREVYASQPLEMPLALIEALNGPTLVLLHSAEAARHFAAECDRLGIDKSVLALATIGPRVTDVVGDGWAEVRTASRPNDAALLALAREMCQEPERPTVVEPETDPMPDYAYTQASADSGKSGSKGTILLVLLAFAIGAGLAGWLAWSGTLGIGGAVGQTEQVAAAPAEQALLPSPVPEEGEATEETPAQDAQRPYDPVGTLETRLALLEERLSRLDTQASAASGNAARAEGLLVAFASRRMVDKGERLGYLEDQLKLRFANAQPLAVDTLVTFAREPVTLDGLSSRLDAIAPELLGEDDESTGWNKLRQDLSNLFVVRRDSTPTRKPADRMARARLMLAAGRVDQAIEEVQGLPNAEAAQQWVVDARRYASAQRALDLIETTAMLEPTRLQDSEGQRVDQPSPLAEPAKAASPAN
jgi:uroporphyrinogen-III synthase